MQNLLKTACANNFSVTSCFLHMLFGTKIGFSYIMDDVITVCMRAGETFGLAIIVSWFCRFTDFGLDNVMLQLRFDVEYSYWNVIAFGI